MAIGFLEAGSAATRGFEMWDSIVTAGSGAWTSDSTTVRNNSRSIKHASAAENGGSRLRTSAGVLVQAGGRGSFYYRTSVISATASAWTFAAVLDASGNLVFDISIRNSKISVRGASTSFDGSATLSADTWYRISFAYVITSVSNFTIKVWVSADGGGTPSLERTITNSDVTLSNAAASKFQIQNRGSSISGAAYNEFWSDIYLDDGTGLDETGDIHVTPKLPNANVAAADDFDTGIGSSPSNRWENVDDRPVDTASGWEQAASTQVSEGYGIQGVSVGDVDLSGDTIVGYGGWIYAKRDSTARWVNFVGEGQNKAAGTSLTITITNGVVATGDTIFITLACDPGTSSQTGSATGATVSWSVEEDVTNAGDVQHVLLRGDVTSGGTITALSVSWTGSITPKAASAVLYRSVGTRSTTGGGQTSDTDPNTINAINNKTVPAYGLAVGGSAVESETAGTVAASSGTPALANTDGGGGAINTTGGGDSSNVANKQAYAENQTGTDSTSYSQAWTNGTDAASSGGVYNPATGAGTEKLILNNSEHTIALSGILKTIQAYATSASYPTSTPTIGLKSTGNAANTFLYECGVQIAYIPGAFTYEPEMFLPIGILMRRHGSSA